MANQETYQCSCLLISIEANNRDALFDCYRDYLVFMSLVRDGVRSTQYRVYGFCWLKNQCLMIIQPENEQIGKYLLRLLKRYHFWLLQRGPSMSEFKLRMLELEQTSWILDSLRFMHQRPVAEKIVEDAMDYHWHSHHVYNGFWSMYWLDTDFILAKFAANRLVAMNRFRQYMLHQHRLDFTKMLNSDDCSDHYINLDIETSDGNTRQAVAEINSHYHRSLLERTRISFSGNGYGLVIHISVEKNLALEDKSKKNFTQMMKSRSN